MFFLCLKMRRKFLKDEESRHFYDFGHLKKPECASAHKGNSSILLKVSILPKKSMHA